jgi:peroxin-14
MATVLGGVGYGLYFTAKRYIIPLVAPPTPPQLESDKAQIDASFERAFALLDQLSTDTTALKSAEEQRTSRLDAALLDLEETVKILKEADRRRDDDARRTADEVRGLRDLIPKALEANKENQEQRLRELGTELKSLKTLVGNRVAGPRPGESAVGAGALRAQAGLYGNAQSQSQQPQQSQPNGTQAATSQTASPSTDGPSGGSGSGYGVSGVNAAEVPRTSSPYSRLTNGKAAIPAWQMAAQKKTEEDKKDTSESGTITETTVGA